MNTLINATAQRFPALASTAAKAIQPVSGALANRIVAAVPASTSTALQVAGSTSRFSALFAQCMAKIGQGCELAVRNVTLAQNFVGTKLLQNFSNPYCTAIGEYLTSVGSTSTALMVRPEGALLTAVEALKIASTALGVSLPIITPAISTLWNYLSYRRGVSSEAAANELAKRAINETAADDVDSRVQMMNDRIEELQGKKAQYKKLSERSLFSLSGTVKFLVCNISPMMLLPQIGVPAAAVVILGSAVAHLISHHAEAHMNRKAAEKMDDLIDDMKQALARDEMYQKQLAEAEDNVRAQLEITQREAQETIDDLKDNNELQRQAYAEMLDSYEESVKEKNENISELEQQRGYLMADMDNLFTENTRLSNDKNHLITHSEELEARNKAQADEIIRLTSALNEARMHIEKPVIAPAPTFARSSSIPAGFKPAAVLPLQTESLQTETLPPELQLDDDEDEEQDDLASLPTLEPSLQQAQTASDWCWYKPWTWGGSSTPSPIITV
ncbi:hypothetical protein [Parendozoicomonas haliclonae]|uniref:Uncharacterized protein n=1 Tax=Parendozoicomonas haliclonae TaxID=1960125 RepID=A0A1X7APJ3_9GAMM|nr:hypothetical protein [Parendozoicomonas haliclonae]SMA50234.1 hypothetical protein EHSB41UT_04027 [Parendozoicomonas haliclonae]